MKKRVIALLLCAVMLVTCMGVGIFAPPDIKLVDAESGEAVSTIAIPQSERVKIATDYESANEIGYQWQLSPDGKAWFNIYGQTGESIQLSYAMVCNMLSDEGTAQVRCVVTDGDSEYETREAEVSVDYSAPAQSPKQAAPAKVSAVQNDAATQADGDAEEPSEIYNIVINYKFGSGSKHSGETAYEQYAASISAGQAFTEKVTLPVITGYAAYLEGETTPITEYQFNIESVNKNISVDIVYQPATVNYTVKYFFQNIEDDKYTLDDSMTRNTTGTTEKVVPDNLAVAVDGFTSLYYERPEIAADGSTVVEIYYDRNYYLLSLDLDGGYGAEPMYARYGTDINIADPTRAGYRFEGWSPALPDKMPAENTKCTAQWKADDTAKVTVVIWGENANDEDYSFISDAQIDVEPDKKLTYKDLNGQLICGKEEHTHSASCGSVCPHKHDLVCYGLSSSAKSVSPNDKTAWWDDSKPEDYFAKLGLEDNCLYYDDKNAAAASRDNYYLRFNGNYYELTEAQFNKLKGTELGKTSDNTSRHPDYFYKYSINASGISCTHTHTDSCYACGKKAHTHDDSCRYNTNYMDSNLWTLVRSDEVTVAADGSTVMNLYYDRTEFTLTFKSGNSIVKTIKEKWGKDIHSEFPIKDGNETIWWKVPSGCQSFVSGNNLGSIDTMPHENITFTKYDSESGAKIYYYVETINGAAGDTSYKGKNYNQYKVIDLNYNSGTSLTYKEEFHDITGFTQGDSNPTLPKDGKVKMQQNNYLYYTRNSYELSFFNYKSVVDGKTESVQYEASLAGKYFVPAYPKELEPGAYEFAGWYTTAGCYDGSEADLNTMTMPAADLRLYANWTLVKHDVRVWLTSDMKDIIKVDGKDVQEVIHGKFATAPAEDPVNGSWDFIGWFYKDANGNEKAFDFENIPVRQDLDIYAKWGSKTPKEYTVYYKTIIDGKEVEIAAPTHSSGIAGNTKTFDAKTGDALYEAYRNEGYFPDAASKSLLIDVDVNKNVVTFWYTQKEAVPYTVRYVYEDGTTVFDDKVVDDNRKVVVTENALKKSGYLPDAMQKTLILSAEGPNVITFVYRADTQHAYYTRTHYLEDVNGEFTIERDYFEAVGDIGTTYSIEPNEYTGFTYDKGHTGEVKSGKLTQDGLDLKLYYTRNSYPYTVRYLDKDTLKEVAPTVERDAVKYGKQVTENALSIPGYTVDASQKNLIVATDESKNVITFYYTENQVTINYVAVGAGVAEGICSVSNGSETVKVITGAPDGSTATIKGNDPTYKFVGWYSDANCEHKVSDDYKYVPEKNSDGMYAAATYYAKFEYNLTSMTLRKVVKDGAYDANDMFIFTITDSKGSVFAKVTVTAGQAVTISGLTVGETYTITEDNKWSWRYKDQASIEFEMTADPTQNVVEVTNKVETNKWLGASSYAINQCVNTISYKINEFFAKLFG